MNPNSTFPTPTPEEEATLRALDSLEHPVLEVKKPAPRPTVDTANTARPTRTATAVPAMPAKEIPKPATSVTTASVKPEPIEPPVTPKPEPAPVLKPEPREAAKPQPTPATPSEPPKPKHAADDPTGIKEAIESAPSRPIFDFFAAQNARFKRSRGLRIGTAIIAFALVAGLGYFVWQYFITQ